LYVKPDEGKQPIHAKMPHLRLGVGINPMTASEQREAAATVLEAAERLSGISAKA
jgi:hypothetical protein